MNRNQRIYKPAMWWFPAFCIAIPKGNHLFTAKAEKSVEILNPAH